MSIAQNLTQILSEIQQAKEQATCPQISEEVKLVAVTKNHEITAMREAIDNSVTAIGENRIQEAMGKYTELQRTAEWHLIGHLQTNKVRQAVSLFDYIHSVDSQKLAVEINRVAGISDKRQNVLIQVNVADEKTKFGISINETKALAECMNELEHIRLCGLMTVAPFYENPEHVRPVFKELYEMFMEVRSLQLSNVNMEWLSMGMTHDYKIAIQEGANLVRIGTGIFGSRQY